MMKIEQLQLRESCLRELKGSGINEVEEFVEFLKNVAGNATVSLRMSEKCFDEAMTQLEALGLWPEDETPP